MNKKVKYSILECDQGFGRKIKLRKGLVSTGRGKVLVSSQRGVRDGHSDKVTLEQKPESEGVPWVSAASGHMCPA